MTPESLDWQKTQSAAVRTENDLQSYKEVMKRLQNLETVRLLHAAMGFASEAGEFADQLKKHIFYGTSLDRVNLFEEGGDISWYLRIAADALADLVGGKCSFEEMIKRNIAKLEARYPKGFSEKGATNRDLDKERSILEGGGL